MSMHDTPEEEIDDPEEMNGGELLTGANQILRIAQENQDTIQRAIEAGYQFPRSVADFSASVSVNKLQRAVREMALALDQQYSAASVVSDFASLTDQIGLITASLVSPDLTQVLSPIQDSLNEMMKTIWESTSGDLSKHQFWPSQIALNFDLEHILEHLGEDQPVRVERHAADWIEPEIAFDVLTGERSTEELPEQLKDKGKQLSAYAYDHGIAPASLFLVFLAVLEVISDPDLASSSDLVESIIILLVALQAMARNQT